MTTTYVHNTNNGRVFNARKRFSDVTKQFGKRAKYRAKRAFSRQNRTLFMAAAAQTIMWILGFLVLYVLFMLALILLINAPWAFVALVCVVLFTVAVYDMVGGL